MVRQVDRERCAEIRFPLVDLAAANAWAGHDKEAKEAAAQLQKVYPGFTVQTWAGIHWTDDPTFNAQYQRIVEGLRKAGLPEGEKKANWLAALSAMSGCPARVEPRRAAPCSHLGIEGAKRERVRCSSPIGWPVYPRLRGTRSAPPSSAALQCRSDGSGQRASPHEQRTPGDHGNPAARYFSQLPTNRRRVQYSD